MVITTIYCITNSRILDSRSFLRQTYRTDDLQGYVGAHPTDSLFWPPSRYSHEILEDTLGAERYSTDVICQPAIFGDCKGPFGMFNPHHRQAGNPPTLGPA
ncbi:predicted protein [Botrytis cinerea T4]|uniref:Uncharacterized protein n=1 Tax=Botryotinia fuckeliana (strain T4) TaxID=999810 RepID=G2YCX0_BOTF4|nr:predicted protein [Botrytis cinerea T4]